jgi:hypothetical protein
MDNGPVTSRILTLITEDKPQPIWAEYISAPLGDYEVKLFKEAPIDRLSPAEERLMTEIFNQYGHRNRWDLIDNVMHKLPEWQDPQGSSIPITIRDLLKAAGEDETQIRAVIKELHAIKSAEEDFARVYA